MIRIKIEQGWSGGFFASSPDLEGLQVAAPSRQAKASMSIPCPIAAASTGSGYDELFAVARLDASREASRSVREACGCVYQSRSGTPAGLANGAASTR